MSNRPPKKLILDTPLPGDGSKRIRRRNRDGTSHGSRSDGDRASETAGASVEIDGAGGVAVSEHLQERTPVIFVGQSLGWSEIDVGGGTATASD